jgi:large subunit ribosomal protein L21
MYAILSHGGRQYRVSAGDRLLVDRLEAEVGSVVALEPVLLTGGDGKTGLGNDVDGMRVAVTVLAHRRGRKLRIFKYKAKKRSRKVAGYRSDLTELRVESLLAKGATLPKAIATSGGGTAERAAAAGRPAPAARAARSRTRASDAKISATSAAAGTTAPAQKAVKAATQPHRSTAKRVSTHAAPPAISGARAADDSGVAESGFSESGTAKPKAAARTAKAVTKTSKRGAAAKDKETGDGA